MNDTPVQTTPKYHHKFKSDSKRFPNCPATLTSTEEEQKEIRLSAETATQLLSSKIQEQ